MKQLSRKKNMILGLILPYFAIAISFLSSFFLIPIVLDNIGDKNYGLISFCESITVWLSVISTSLGSSYAFFASKENKENGEEKRTNAIFTKILGLIGVAAFVFASIVIVILKFSGFQISKYTEAENNLIFILLLISSGNVAVTIIFSIFTLYNNYNRRFGFVQGSQIILNLISFANTLIIALTIKSVIFIALNSLLISTLNGVISLFYSIKIRKMQFDWKKPDESKHEVRAILAYSSIVLVSTIVYNFDFNLDKTLLGLLVSAETVAIYSLSVTFTAKGGLLVSSFTNVYRPTVFQLYANKKIDDANYLFLKVSKIQAITALLIVGGYISCGYHFTTGWIGSGRIEVYFYSLVLFALQIVPWSTSISSEAWHANNLHKIPMIFNIISSVTNLGLSVLLLFLLKTELAIWACIIGTVVPNIIFHYIVLPIYAKKKLDLPMGKYFLNTLKITILAALAAAPSIYLTYIMKDLNINPFLKAIVEGSSFVLIYFGLLFIFERKLIMDTIRKVLKKSPTVEEEEQEQQN